jgi:hypothetical protein
VYSAITARPGSCVIAARHSRSGTRAGRGIGTNGYRSRRGDLERH